MSYYRPPRFPIANKLKIAAAVVTIIVIIVIMAESIVIVDAGHRGVVLYLGAVENRVLGEGVHFIAPFRTSSSNGGKNTKVPGRGDCCV